MKVFFITFFDPKIESSNGIHIGFYVTNMYGNIYVTPCAMEIPFKSDANYSHETTNIL
jgi:hypothetical protein